jgi:hypothetical protein
MNLKHLPLGAGLAALALAASMTVPAGAADDLRAFAPAPAFAAAGDREAHEQAEEEVWRSGMSAPHATHDRVEATLLSAYFWRASLPPCEPLRVACA